MGSQPREGRARGSEEQERLAGPDSGRTPTVPSQRARPPALQTAVKASSSHCCLTVCPQNTVPGDALWETSLWPNKILKTQLDLCLFQKFLIPIRH